MIEKTLKIKLISRCSRLTSGRTHLMSCPDAFIKYLMVNNARVDLLVDEGTFAANNEMCRKSGNNSPEFSETLKRNIEAMERRTSGDTHVEKGNCRNWVSGFLFLPPSEQQDDENKGQYDDYQDRCRQNEVELIVLGILHLFWLLRTGLSPGEEDEERSAMGRISTEEPGATRITSDNRRTQ